MTDKRDLLILGGGLVGMTLALAAAKHGMTSHVIDRAKPEELTAEGSDGRASAISTASWNLFANIGLATSIEPLGCPIDAIAVSDGLRPGRIDFRPQPDEGSLGPHVRQPRLAPRTVRGGRGRAGDCLAQRRRGRAPRARHTRRHRDPGRRARTRRRADGCRRRAQFAGARGSGHRCGALGLSPSRHRHRAVPRTAA